MPSDFTILRIDASARRERSLSRALADRFIGEWRARWPDDALLHRDVGSSPPPTVSEAWIGAAFTPKNERRSEQRRLLELYSVLKTPEYKAQVRRLISGGSVVNATFLIGLSSAVMIPALQKFQRRARQAARKAPIR